jgi:hypothetical protein
VERESSYDEEYRVKPDVPRYLVPITWKRRVVLGAGIHRDWKEALPLALGARRKNVEARLV